MPQESANPQQGQGIGRRQVSREVVDQDGRKQVRERHDVYLSRLEVEDQLIKAKRRRDAAEAQVAALESLLDQMDE